ncbi:sulfatase-like hydrolase/transferase [Croceiramulus getboli]|nr:sulfatase-like hydrolase/transferase [Flavobacteriaceae bacterium YJPT1-3]
MLTDDQRADAVGFMGNPQIKTPHLDILASQGIVFSNAYVTTSICSVSRASILTGQYARRHNIWGFSKNFSPQQWQKTYPIVMRNQGYYTGFIGKFGVGNELPQADFDYWRGFEGQGSFRQKNEAGDDIHLTRMISDQIITFIDTVKSKAQAFCLSVSFKAPHVEGDPGYFLPDPKYGQLHNQQVLSEPVQSAPEFFNHFPPAFTENNVARNRWKSRFANPQMQQENIRKYYQLIHGIDVVVGELVEALTRNGLLDNTIIIYTSDNGFYLGEYGFAGKWYGSEPSIRVPLMIFDGRNPLSQRKTRKDIALNIDLAPTLLKLAGITSPKEMQGYALMPQPESPRDYFLYEHLWQSTPRYFIPSTEGIVYTDKKYMRYFMNRDTTELIFEELYDLNKDPLEINNLMNAPTFTSLKKSLKDTLHRAKLQASVD